MQPRFRLVWFIFIPFLTVALLVEVIVAWQVSTEFRQFLENELRMELRDQAQIMASELAQTIDPEHGALDAEAINDLCHSLAPLLGVRITVVVPTGEVIGDTLLPPERMENHALRPEIQAALAGHPGKAMRHSTSSNQHRIYVAVPISAKGQVIAAVRASQSTEVMRTRLRTLYIRLGTEALIVSLAVLLVSLFIASRISQPISALRGLAQSYARGDFTSLPADPHPRELAELTTALNRMGRLMRARLEAIAQQKKILRAEIRKRRQIQRDLEMANKKLAALVRIDGLTGLANRRRFDEFLTNEWNRMLRARKPLTLLMCDVDFFKQYNDRYGHQQGDECLKTLAHCLEWCCQRSTDLAARYGGEEFALVLPDTSLDGARRLASCIREELRRARIPHAASSVAPWVTISIGIGSCVPSAQTSPARLIQMADDALYAAKHQGRNKIVSTEP